MFVQVWSFLSNELSTYHLREVVPSLTSDMGKKTVSVLPHTFLLPQRANLGYILSIYPLRYSRSQLCAEAKSSVLRHVLSAWSKWMKTKSPAEQNMLYHTPLCFISEPTSRLPQGVYRECISRVSPVGQQKIVCEDWYCLLLHIWGQRWHGVP